MPAGRSRRAHCLPDENHDETQLLAGTSLATLGSVVMTAPEHNQDNEKHSSVESNGSGSPVSLVALDLAPALSSRDIHRLLDAVGGSPESAADTLLGLDARSLGARLELSSSQAEVLARSFSSGVRMVGEEEHARLDEGIDLVSFGDSRYPRSLAVIPDPPLLLRCLGNPASAAVGIAIVGSRKPSDYGIRMTPRFVRACSDVGISVVSGGARGIDGIAHRSAVLDGVPTLAVLANGLSIPYPPEHRPLFQAIIQAGGALVSETPVRTPPRPWLFPRRNRIISGMSLGVIVIEAAARSGATITARLAVEEHGRDALAVPGRIGDRLSEGCLRMLAEGWAGIARSPQEAVADLRRSL